MLLRRDTEWELTFFVVFAPNETTLKELMKIAGMRWSIDLEFEETKGLTALEEYEVRKYVAW